MKLAIGVVLVAAAGALAWHFRDHVLIGQATALLRAPMAAGAAGAGVAPGPAGSALRKCVLNGQPVYTNSACPAGSREEALTGGSLSVLPAAPVPASAGPAGVGHAGALLPKSSPTSEADLKAQRIEAIVHK